MKKLFIILLILSLPVTTYAQVMNPNYWKVVSNSIVQPIKDIWGLTVKGTSNMATTTFNGATASITVKEFNTPAGNYMYLDPSSPAGLIGTTLGFFNGDWAFINQVFDTKISLYSVSEEELRISVSSTTDAVSFANALTYNFDSDLIVSGISTTTNYQVIGDTIKNMKLYQLPITSGGYAGSLLPTIKGLSYVAPLTSTVNVGIGIEHSLNIIESNDGYPANNSALQFISRDFLTNAYISWASTTDKMTFGSASSYDFDNQVSAGAGGVTGSNALTINGTGYSSGNFTTAENLYSNYLYSNNDLILDDNNDGTGLIGIEGDTNLLSLSANILTINGNATATQSTDTFLEIKSSKNGTWSTTEDTVLGGLKLFSSDTNDSGPGYKFTLTAENQGTSSGGEFGSNIDTVFRTATRTGGEGNLGAVFRVNYSGHILFNDDYLNRDFYIRSQTSGTTLFADASTGYVGIGTTTPFAKLSITGTSGSTAPIFLVASSTKNPLFFIGKNGHMMTGGATPTVSSCGTSPTISGDDNAFRVVVGGGTVTSCLVTFAYPWTKIGGASITPVCNVNETTAGSVHGVAASSTPTTTLINHGATSMAGEVISGQCKGSNNFTY